MICSFVAGNRPKLDWDIYIGAIEITRLPNPLPNQTELRNVFPTSWKISLYNSIFNNVSHQIPKTSKNRGVSQTQEQWSPSPYPNHILTVLKPTVKQPARNWPNRNTVDATQDPEISTCNKHPKQQFWHEMLCHGGDDGGLIGFSLELSLLRVSRHQCYSNTERLKYKPSQVQCSSKHSDNLGPWGKRLLRIIVSGRPVPMIWLRTKLEKLWTNKDDKAGEDDSEGQSLWYYVTWYMKRLLNYTDSLSPLI